MDVSRRGQSSTGLVSTVQSVVGLARERNITFLAASFAYYAFISLFPLLLLAVAVGTAVGGQSFADALIGLTKQYLSAEGATIVERTVDNTQGAAGASVVGIAILLWSALKLFRGLVLAFEEVYETSPDPGIVQEVKTGTVALVGVALGMGLMVGVGAVLGSPALANVPYLDLVGGLTLVVGLVVAFLPLYYVLPPVDVSVREVLPGTVVAAVGWLALQAGFQIYAGSSGKFGLYGILGTVLVFLTWLYFAGVVLLAGATVNVVVEGRSSHVEGE
jgi:membrane protein